MDLIAQLTRLRAIKPNYTEEDLCELARQLRVPLFRIQELVSFYPHLQPLPADARPLYVCTGVSCMLRGAHTIAERVRNEIKQGRCTGMVLYECHCLGRCDHAPAALLDNVPHTLTFAQSAGLQCRPVQRPDEPGEPWKLLSGGIGAFATFLKWRDRPDDFTAYAFAELERAGLRGMGGAGFPTAKKWRAVAGAPGRPKYVICNADESEPGTFKDRELVARAPESVIEGMLLAALAVGAERGIVFIRHEYEPEAATMEEAIEAARDHGILGPNALGTARPFDIELVRSPGGYILGEETALLEALEGRRGEPRNRPPYPATHGLYGQPTLINNVETLVAAVAILTRGADWWLSFGQNGGRGLKLVSVSGDVNQPGVYEIELGTPVRQIIEKAGGVSSTGKLKAFAPGGVSAPWLPASAVDVPYDFGPLNDAGSMLGSGALIVLAEGSPVGEVALNITRFFAEESCGKCVPCRLGTAYVVRMLEEARKHPHPTLPLDSIEALANTLRATSICGLGQVALNGLLSLAHLFPDEVTMDSPSEQRSLRKGNGRTEQGSIGDGDG